MLLKVAVTIAIAAGLLTGGRQDQRPACVPNPAMVGAWHFVDGKDGESVEFTLRNDGYWREWWSGSKGEPSSERVGACINLENGQLQLGIGSIARYESKPRSLILHGGMRFLPGALPAVAAGRDLFGLWHVTRVKSDYGGARITELMLAADGSFRRIESLDLRAPTVTEGTFRVRPRREIEFFDGDPVENARNGIRVERFQFGVGAKSLTLESEYESLWLARGKDPRGFPAEPAPCELEAPDTQLARLGSLRPFELSTYSHPTDIDPREKNELMHRAMRAFLGSAAPLALKATEHGDEGQVYEKYLIVRAGRAEYLYTSSGAWSSQETGSCPITDMRLADLDGRFVEPASQSAAPAVRLLFRSARENSFP